VDVSTKGEVREMQVCRQRRSDFARLVEDLDLHAVDAGPLAAARLIEPALMLVVSIAYADRPRDVGIRLLER
jgi:predicted dinucleotide-binding enzyme